MLADAHSDVKGRESAVTVRMFESIMMIGVANCKTAKRTVKIMSATSARERMCFHTWDDQGLCTANEDDLHRTKLSKTELASLQ